MTVEWLIAAEAELDQAMSFCDSQRTGRGEHLLRRVGQALRLISEHPQAGRLYGPGQTAFELRRVAVDRFPYGLVYRVESTLTILAMAHDRQRPAYWIDRIA